jgi:hypothetical protein
MTNIVSVTPGNYTPGAQTALNFTADIINATWNQANTKLTAFEAKIDGVGAYLAANPVADITADVATAVAVTEPQVTIPASADVSVITSQFDSKYLELVAMLVDKFTTFQSTYFPSESTTYTNTNTWINNALTNPDSAIPAAVAAQILTDDRNRAYTEATAQADALLATFASRRFPMPSGAAASGVLQIQQKSQDIIADSSRKLMMGYIEQMKFAVEKALTLRQEAMSSAVQYVTALASGPDMASKVVGLGYDAQSKLISSAASYYNARTESKRLTSQVEQFNVTTKLQKDEKNQAVDTMIVEERIKALMAEAQTLGQMAASMFNNLHASTGSSYGVNGT